MAADPEKKKGYFATVPIIVVGVLLFIGGCVLVACLVWFEAPRKVCKEVPEGNSSTSEAETICKAYVKQYGKGEWIY